MLANRNWLGSRKWLPFADDDVIQEVAPKGSDDPLAVPVLPGGPESDLLWSNSQGFHKGPGGPEDDVPVDQEVVREILVGEGVSKLLSYPFCGGVGRDPRLPDHPPPVVQDYQDVELPEVPSRHYHEIHRRNQLPVVIEKGLPGLGPPGIAQSSGHPTRHAALRHLDPLWVVKTSSRLLRLDGQADSEVVRSVIFPVPPRSIP